MGETVGLIVNPAAGRDIRRLTGGASVVDNYAKRRVAECVLEGLTSVPDPPTALVMPDTARIAASAAEEVPDAETALLDLAIEGSAADTRRAAARFREEADAIVVLGGDGTSRDTALECGEVPLVSVSTGTNNVVPTAVDGTVAGAAAALVATGAVEEQDVTYRHGMVEAHTASGETVTGLASVELSNRSFIGTRATLDPADLAGGIVSRANPADIGLSSVAGAIASLAPDDSGAIGLRLVDPDLAPRTGRAIVAPGVVAGVGIEDQRHLAEGESMTVDVEEGVVGADGERELELVDELVEFRSAERGPRLVSVATLFEAAAGTGVFED
ncbi:NAD(+)/NADH kinase [Halalkalicoccus jeotgali]|uniref:ATP-NAD/AcoX kinase n=1 Tax=Halalkalicoccus jeotgali (strain DSM 18796 / CECT 7217 / JCM 14584 / KCTC 4019 / B3) TaxID=795797 RepID=D8J6H8_HALJB|nr:NAD(+)/NADH kinase [Halalkalicoccus jeotgali]ADJ13855.1 ATP-NAD/AcoX kinase [Halalkalicoccus jeotgali B3]ELY34099.1 ATP-NAD/AcoX kinase [Halalkalicoccus jeotgali B3]